MSLPEQGAKVATGVVDAMRGQPMLLAVIVLNVVIFAAVVWGVTEQRKDQQELTKMVLEHCLQR